MLDKTTRRLRLYVLACALAGGVFAAGDLFASSAQATPFDCIMDYTTCTGDNTDPWGGGSGGGGGTYSGCSGSGTWVCPIREVGSEGTASGKCTSTGCRKYSESYPVWVCSFRASDTQTKCPPLEQCECR
jgi:hypothetical protein